MSRNDDTLPPLAAPPARVPDDATVVDAAPLVLESAADPHRAATRAITGATAGRTALGRRPSLAPAAAAPARPAVVPPPAPPEPPSERSPPPAARRPAVVAPVTRASEAALPPAAPAAVAAIAPPIAPAAPGAFVPVALPVSPAPPRSGRSLPTRGRVLIGVGATFLILMVVASQGGKKDGPPSLQVQDDIVVSHEDLKKRTEVRPEDFGTRGPRLRVAPSPAASSAAVSPGAAGAISDEELEARRQRRGQDPEDLHAAKRGSGAASARPAVAPPEPSEDSGSLYLEPRPVKAPPGQKQAFGKGSSRDSGTVVVRAGTTLGGRLDGPVSVTSGGSTAVVEITAPGELAGARLVGSASYTQGRVTMRFRTLLLASGQEVDVRAEARDTDGTFGLAVAIPSSGDGRSVEGEVAEEAGTSIVTGAIGGLAGDVVGDYARKKRQGGSRPSYSTPTVTVEAGRELQVFVSETARQ